MTASWIMRTVSNSVRRKRLLPSHRETRDKCLPCEVILENLILIGTSTKQKERVNPWFGELHELYSHVKDYSFVSLNQHEREI